MRNHTIPFTLTLTFTACGTNPCDIGLLYENMTPEQQAMCDQCGNAYQCPDDEGETGDEDLDPGTALTCLDGPKASARGEYCYVGHWTENTIGLDTTGYTLTHKTAADCWTEADAFPCLRSWGDPDATPISGPTECMLCNLYDGLAVPDELLPKLMNLPDYDFPDTFEDWILGGAETAPRRVCVSPFGESRYSGAAYYDAADFQLEFKSTQWWRYQQCPTDDLGEFQPSDGINHMQDDSGEVIGMRPSPGQGIDPQDNLSMRCIDDADCPDGSVCELGWYLGGVNGMIPHPTLCAWDDGSGDENGAAPEGPIVYGLAAWEDGIELTAHSRTEVGVRITPSFLLSLVSAAWNDDQRFDVETGELTYCGPDALCDWLGFANGDRLRVEDLGPLDAAIIGGREIDFVVEHEDGSTTTFVVSLDFDGDLSD